MMNNRIFVLILVIFMSSLNINCTKGFVPTGFTPPAEMVCDDFVLKPIKAEYAEKDYEAVMESADIIHQSLMSKRWPTSSFSYEENVSDLKKKEVTFFKKKGFTYSIFSPDLKQIIGSVYINKGRKGADAAVFFWVRKSAFEAGYDPIVEDELRVWLEEKWPFEKVVFPGRGDKLGKFFSSIFSEKNPGAVIHIKIDENNSYQEAFGIADMETGKNTDKNMLFPIASMTKAYTAVAIMILVEEKKIALDDCVTSFFDNLPDSYKDIKVRHLLGNTSGIVSYNRILSYQENPIKEKLSLGEMIDLFINEPLRFKPGSRFNYSNSNYILLSAIIEKLSGMSYGDFLKEKIFKKSSLNSTFLSINSHHQREKAPMGYVYNNGEFRRHFEDTGHTYGAGMLYATSEDLVKFILALNQNKIISPESLKILYSVQIEHNDGRPDEYAHGFWITDIEGERVIKMEGYCDGFHTNAFYFTEKKMVVAVLPNASGYAENADPTFIARWIHRLVSGKEVNVYREIELPDTQLAEFQGVYEIDSSNRIQVFLKNNQLFTLKTAGQMSEVLPYFKRKFYYPNSFSTLEFLLKNNKVKSMRINHEGKQIEAIKTDFELRNSERININKLKPLTGTYEKGFKCYIDSDKFMFTNGFHRYELFPESETEFFPWHEDSCFVFEKSSGKIVMTYKIGEISIKVNKIK